MGIKTKVEINQQRMNEDLYIGVVMIMYIGYNIALNWMYIKEYLKDKEGGNEWPD
jgi:hypothetical protein